MKALLTVFLFLLFTITHSFAQDTFSIVAVDTVTGEIGSAGASCVGAISGVGAYILSDVIEGIGAIHTQASYLEANQQTAHQQMLLGMSPQQVIDYMVAHDAQGDPTVRQYGVVDLTRRGESAAYTGINCTNYKNHATGPGYSVQGNILSGQMIIDTIRNTFLRTPGPLADRMMTALQAAQIIGADTRCASRGTSSRSSFIKIVRLGDGSTPYLLKIVPDSPINTDPIVLLRAQFDQWKDSLRTTVDPFLSEVSIDMDSLPANGSAQAVITIIPKNNSDTLLAPGLTILLSNTGNGTIGQVSDLGNGTYAATLTAANTPGLDTIRVNAISGTDTVTIASVVHVTYLSITAANRNTEPTGEFWLAQNFPNPFNPSTVIEFSIPEATNVSLKLYAISGEEVITLLDGNQKGGRHIVSVDARLLATGVYYYQLRAGDLVQTKKLVLIR